MWKRRATGPVKLEKKHPLAIRWFHWLNFPILTVMIWSGLLIYWANDVYGVRFNGHEYVKFFPDNYKEVDSSFYRPVAPEWVPRWIVPDPPEVAGQPRQPRRLWELNNRLAEGLGWHFLFMWLFAINGLLYVLFLVFSGQWRHMVPRLRSFRDALHVVAYDLFLTRKPIPREKYNGAQRFAYTGITVMGLFALLSGLAIYKPTQAAWLTGLFGGYTNARFVHFWLMVGFVLFFVVHVLQVARAGWNNFRAMVTGYELVPVDPSDPSASAGVPASPDPVPVAAGAAEIVQ